MLLADKTIDGGDIRHWASLRDVRSKCNHKRRIRHPGLGHGHGPRNAGQLYSRSKEQEQECRNSGETSRQRQSLESPDAWNALDVFEGELFPSSNTSSGQLKDKVDVRGKIDLTLATLLT